MKNHQLNVREEMDRRGAVIAQWCSAGQRAGWSGVRVPASYPMSKGKGKVVPGLN
jgi:hypothetical protein